ncbi:MAG: SDR family NAD(P)-dependent oxidoreductase [Granulosicoccus sp.]
MAVRSIESIELKGQSKVSRIACDTVAVTDEHPQLAASIATSLRANGCSVQVTCSPDALTQELVVTLALGDGNACDIHWRALAQAQAFHRAGGKSLVLLQDTGGRFDTGGPSHGWHGGMAALARTIALEWPQMRVRCVDLAVDSDDIQGTTQRLMAALASMQCVVGSDLSGRLYSLQAVERMSERVPVTTPTLATDVWLVSGGARGVTAACIEALAKRTPGRFALLGRSVPAEWPSNIAQTGDIKELRRLLAASALAAGERPEPKDIERIARQALAGQEIRSTLIALEAAGVTARYYACNIAEPQQVDEVVARIQRELGPVTAMVHGAGVLADSLLVDKTRSELQRVFETKVGGLQNLLEALGDTVLTHMALFSSAAAFYGNTGQADYAMANDVLNRVAKSFKQRWPAATVKSFNWGPWDSGMVDQTLARYFEERGIGLIPVQEGAALFADEMLSADKGAVELLVGDAWANSRAS